MKKGADMMKMMTFLRISLLLVIAVVFCSGFALIGHVISPSFFLLTNI